MASVMQSLEPFLKKTVSLRNSAVEGARLDFAGIFQLMVLRALRLLASPIGRNISVAIVLPTALGPNANLAEL
ncbi:hypothetical protein EMIHUDRAFT_198206 [Emiliania huxleyi CCMP1516]|uniref:Uncharacterized protein n=2 Tax=Emiliania huxleyi TaxID=2903 RepID=A0A0D3IEF6_EMIH1|nr:hypothetical protein EMIHUDRAFT_198206 [Emiliania huxleyi CCMP1516]EOD09641.1 hypothetical protein EMIHUDRAFT_198206 [Emiliania huxleyi CCMP1516]|eukprot:XP_005762070.1 hypothetical protein EMIHUDRAFT_198206 [Emiliania huxleyi CCMP1516]